MNMRECWNWQTGQTKDLVVIAIVWVQVPSPASKNNIIQKDGVIFLTGAFLDPKGSRSPLRSGRRRTDIHRMSCAPSPAAAPHDPKGSRSRLRLGRCTTCGPPDHVHPISRTSHELFLIICYVVDKKNELV